MESPSPARRATCVVVPCYNEQSRLDVAAFERYLAADTGVRLLLVNDGSSDGTQAVLETLARDHSERVSVLSLSPNGGKAEAVRRGVLEAVGRADAAYVGFWDADLATPLEAVQVFIDVFERLPGVDVVIGTRVGLLGRNIDRRATRHYLGRVFATAASIVLSLPIYDTQCGAKLFRVNDRTRSLFESPFGSRWIFDVEIFARYCKQRAGEAGIYELPLDHWRDVGESKVRSLDFVRAFGEMLIIYRRYRPGKGHWFLDLVTAPFIRYAGAGAVGTLIHYGTLTALVELAGMTPTMGSVGGATAGALLNYILNYHLTFASQLPHRRTLPRFMAVAALGIVINGFVVKAATERLHLHYLLAQLVATLLILSTGYVLNKIWTFARRE